MAIMPQQITAARALLRMPQEDLAHRARVSVLSVQRMEAAWTEKEVAPATLGKVRRALEEAGIEFIDHGVRDVRWTPEAVERRYRKCAEIIERSAARLSDAPPFSEDDLYDENGLPA